MANGRTPIDLGFAEFAAQLVAELQEAVCSAQSEQEARRAELAERAAMSVSQFARRFVVNNEVEPSRAYVPGTGPQGHCDCGWAPLSSGGGETGGDPGC